MNVYVPDTLGVPVIAPAEFIFKPAGNVLLASVFAITEYVYGAIPPSAAIVTPAYAEFIFAAGRTESVVILNLGATVNISVYAYTSDKFPLLCVEYVNLINLLLFITSSVSPFLMVPNSSFLSSLVSVAVILFVSKFLGVTYSIVPSLKVIPNFNPSKSNSSPSM